MIPKSIKWRLQIWYGVILLIVLAGFGITAMDLEKGRQFRRVDHDLQRRINALVEALRRPQRGPGFGEAPPEDRQPPPDQPPPEELTGGPESDALPHPRRGFHLPPQQESLFAETAPNSYYYYIWARDGRLLSHSTNTTAEAANLIFKTLKLPAFGPGRVSPQQRPAAPPEPQPPRMRGDYREICLTTPPGETIMVGRSLAPELAELRHVGLMLAGVGGVILILGLAGGWWIAGRVIRPIRDISGTAAKISAGDLSQRINTSETESELGQLALVLNSTFSRLESAFSQQKQFASDAAHELRTPVSVILTQTQTALNRERDAASYKQTVEACHRAAQRMRRLIESLLELARFDAGQEVLKRMDFDLSRTVGDCLELVQPLAEEGSVKTIVELAPLQMTGDPERLAQVITNLLTNAIQYNKAGGGVRVTLESQSGLAVVTISDTGQGIAAMDLPRVFERFYRADQSRTGGGNAGLGLSICKAIVEAHGGTIEVSSTVGSGTTFVVRLPVSGMPLETG